MKSTNPISVDIITAFASYYGGVEHFNSMLKEVMVREGYSVRVVSKESLKDSLLVKALVRFRGLNRAISRYYNNSGLAQSADVAICNGEFGYGINHPHAINVFHGSYFGYADAKKDFVPEKVYRGLLKLADEQRSSANGKYVVAVSAFVARILERQGIEVGAVINNAVDTEKFKPNPATPRIDRCLFVGSYDYFGKGIDYLEKAAGLGIGIDCITSERPKDSRLHWLGNISNDRLPEIYPQYKALLLPSRFEGSSLVVLEAMACGTPVITSAVGSGCDILAEIPEFVVDGPSVLLPDQMRDRLVQVEKDHESYAIRARDYVLKHHDYTDWKNKWLNVIDEVRQK